MTAVVLVHFGHVDTPILRGQRERCVDTSVNKTGILRVLRVFYNISPERRGWPIIVVWS